MSITQIGSQFLNIASANALSVEGQLRVNGGNLIYHDGTSEKTLATGGGGSGGFSEAVTVSGSRAMNSAGTATPNFSMGGTPTMVITVWVTGGGASGIGYGRSVSFWDPSIGAGNLSCATASQATDTVNFHEASSTKNIQMVQFSPGANMQCTYNTLTSTAMNMVFTTVGGGLAGDLFYRLTFAR